MEREHVQRPADAVAPAPVEDAAPAAESTSALSAPVPGVASRKAAPGQSGADPLGGTRPSDDVVDALRRRSGSGTPLPPTLADRFGEQYGTDLSGVRVHGDSEAHELAQSVGAAAFTYGSDVYLSEGKSVAAGGDHLIAHELAHVVQQATGRASAPGAAGPVIGRADDPAEAEADRMAEAALGALRRQVPAPAAGLAGTDTESAVRRLTVAQLRERHEAFIREAGGEAGAHDESGRDSADSADTADSAVDAKTDGAESGGSEHETETDSGLDDATDADVKDDSDTGSENDSGSENKNETDGGNENDVDQENENDGRNENDVDNKNENDVTDDNDSGNENDGDVDNKNETDGGNENDVTDDTDLGSDADTAESDNGLPNPDKLRERIVLHKRASAILAGGLGAGVSAGDRERIVRAALDVLATDPWFEAFRFLQFDELVPFVRDRREAIERALATVLKKQAKAKGKRHGAGFDADDDGDGTDEPADVEASVVHLESGLLHRDDEAPTTGLVDTSESSAPDQGDGWESFVVGTDLTIRMASRDEDESDEAEEAELLAESEVLFSGEISVRVGRIEAMVNTGDRSKPSEEQLAEFLRQLEGAGMSLEFDMEGFAGFADQTGAQILMEHEADEADASEETKV